jgi:drug/metabolite transporter (DMT)-like permease
MIKLYTELLFATLFWGFGFVTTVWALTAVGPLWLTTLRFLIALLILNLKPLRYSFKEFKAVFWSGFFLFLLLGFQTWGLLYTSPTKSGFITVLYVLFVPIFEKFFLKKPFRKILFLWILIALIGSALICQTTDFHSFNFGDFLTLLCAMAAAAQFMAINKRVHEVESPVHFHAYQCIWMILFSIVLAIPLEGFGFLKNHWSTLAWVGLIQLGIFSSALAFLIQIRVQRFIPPATVAIFMLLESPWAMISSVVFLKENLTGLQILGAVLILFAAIAETISLSNPTPPKPELQ